MTLVFGATQHSQSRSIFETQNPAAAELISQRRQERRDRAKKNRLLRQAMRNMSREERAALRRSRVNQENRPRLNRNDVPGFLVYQPQQLVRINPGNVISGLANGYRFDETGMPLAARVNVSARTSIVHVLENHYRNNSDALWIDEAGMPNTEARALLRVLHDAGAYGLTSMHYHIDDLKPGDGFAKQASFELALSARVLRYLTDAKHGIVRPEQLSKFHHFPQNEVTIKALFSDLLDVRNPARFLRAAHPQMKAFAALKQELASLYSNAAGGETPNKLRRVIAAMERLRWHPKDFGQTHVLINQPAYSASLTKRGQPVFKMDVIVGKKSNPTDFFHDEIEYVEYNPYWGIPRSILVEKFLPKLRENPGYISKIGYELKRLNGKRVASASVNWNVVGDDFPFQVRQPPGRNNALGELKIMFPNEHAIYMHDTPAKALFDKQHRAFSHGCIRLRQPRKMAAALLGTSENRIAADIGTKRNTKHRLTNKVPVYVGYFTAWPETDGTVRYYADIYGRDEALARALTGEDMVRRAVLN